jgi:hypothetical protein
MECTCEGSMFADLMCLSCLEKTEKILLDKLEKLDEQKSEIEGALDDVQFHIENPTCTECGKKAKHCDCSK